MVLYYDKNCSTCQHYSDNQDDANRHVCTRKHKVIRNSKKESCPEHESIFCCIADCSRYAKYKSVERSDDRVCQSCHDNLFTKHGFARIRKYVEI